MKLWVAESGDLRRIARNQRALKKYCRAASGTRFWNVYTIDVKGRISFLSISPIVNGLMKFGEPCDRFISMNGRLKPIDLVKDSKDTLKDTPRDTARK